MRTQDILRHMAGGNQKTETGKTVGQVIETLNEEQRNVVNYLIYKALTIGEGKKDEKGSK